MISHDQFKSKSTRGKLAILFPVLTCMSRLRNRAGTTVDGMHVRLNMRTLRDLLLGLSLLCSKIYLLFLPELPKNFTHCS